MARFLMPDGLVEEVLCGAPAVQGPVRGQHIAPVEQVRNKLDRQDDDPPCSTVASDGGAANTDFS